MGPFWHPILVPDRVPFWVHFGPFWGWPIPPSRRGSLHLADFPGFGGGPNPGVPFDTPFWPENGPFWGSFWGSRPPIWGFKSIKMPSNP